MNRVVVPLAICAGAAFLSTMMASFGLRIEWALGAFFAALLLAVLVSIYLMLNRNPREDS